MLQPHNSTPAVPPIGVFSIDVPVLQVDPKDLIVVSCTASNNMTSATYVSDTCCTCKE